jgi:hypothetical protein
MKIQYSIEKNDILVNYLYVISKMKQFAKDKKEIFIFILLALTLIEIVVLYKKRYLEFIFFFIISTLLIIFHKKAINYYYKIYSNWNVKRLIKTNPKILGVKEFEFIEISKITIETINIIDLTLINSINEIEEYFFIRLKNKTSIIIPKAKITSNNIEEVTQFLKHLSKNLNIEYIEDLDWKW